MNSYFLVLLSCQVLFWLGASGTTNTSWEHRIRAELLKEYDRKVRPVLKPQKALEVSFALTISRLVKVDSKHQVMILDTWVVQTWRNEFLTWNKSDYGEVSRVSFFPDEIWVPDISLFNNGDTIVTKVTTEVSVSNEGMCVWTGPATFQSTCELNLNDWPFDDQSCALGFGSFTYGIDRMNIKLFETKNQFTNRFISSGDWDVDGIETSLTETDHGDCCPFNFSEVVYTLNIKRKPLYYLFYLTIPCIILTILSLSSFLIPAESGERIGFVTTILLAMVVFLLLIPSFLPEKSDGVPILGINLQVTLSIIVLILFANIAVLKVYFMEDTPPDWVETMCTLCSKKKGRMVQRIHVSGAEIGGDPKPKPVVKSMNDIELSEARAATPRNLDSKGSEFTWKKASIKLDHFFVVFFLIVAIIASTATYLA